MTNLLTNITNHKSIYDTLAKAGRVDTLFKFDGNPITWHYAKRELRSIARHEGIASALFSDELDIDNSAERMQILLDS